MMEVKIHLDKEIFEKVKSGEKKFEIRLGNKGIEEGNTLIIIQRDEGGNPTNNIIRKKAGHVQLTKDLDYWDGDDIKKFGFEIIQLEDVDEN